jgi:molybdopterin synthase sulfur carrier subunit
MRVLYFAWLRETIGLGEEEIALPPDVTTPRELIGFLRQRGAVYAQAFARQELIRCAVDQAFCPLDAPFGGAAEIGFFPPVTGG